MELIKITIKRTTTIYSLLLLILLQCACNKQLDELPKDALVEGNAIIDQQTANIALNGVYYRFANASPQTTNWLSSQVYPGVLSGYLDYGVNDVNESSNNLGKTSYNSVWGRYYGLINAANGVIGQVNGLDDGLFSEGRKAQILAEARFMRAYGHFKVLSWMGQWFDINSPYGILIQDQFITTASFAKARSNVKDSYQFILDDVDDAIAHASDGNGDITVNKWTAMALKMRVLLSRGQGDDYAQCAALGQAILNSSPFALEGNTKDLFYSKGLTSTEMMLGVVPQANQGAYYYNTSGNYVVRSGYYVATDALNTLLENDPRKSWYIGETGNFDKGYYFIKYVQPSLTTTQLSEVAYAFRLAEVYIMTAEATVRSGGDPDKAKDLVRTVMERAGVTNFSGLEAAADRDALLLQIFHEYVRSFVGEDDQYYFALLRFPLATVTALRPTITSTDQYIYPIPHTEFENNPLIGEQNPGYSK